MVSDAHTTQGLEMLAPSTLLHLSSYSLSFSRLLTLASPIHRRRRAQATSPRSPGALTACRWSLAKIPPLFLALATDQKDAGPPTPARAR